METHRLPSDCTSQKTVSGSSDKEELPDFVWTILSVVFFCFLQTDPFLDNNRPRQCTSTTASPRRYPAKYPDGIQVAILWCNFFPPCRTWSPQDLGLFPASWRCVPRAPGSLCHRLRSRSRTGPPVTTSAAWSWLYENKFCEVPVDQMAFGTEAAILGLTPFYFSFNRVLNIVSYKIFGQWRNSIFEFCYLWFVWKSIRLIIKNKIWSYFFGFFKTI